jgi:hypothetical protein
MMQQMMDRGMMGMGLVALIAVIPLVKYVFFR